MDNVYAFRGVIKEHNKRQGNFKVEIKDAGKVIEAVIKPWQPKSPAPGFVEIKNGSKVRLHFARICSINKKEERI